MLTRYTGSRSCQLCKSLAKFAAMAEQFDLAVSHFFLRPVNDLQAPEKYCATGRLRSKLALLGKGYIMIFDHIII